MKKTKTRPVPKTRHTGKIIALLVLAMPFFIWIAVVSMETEDQKAQRAAKHISSFVVLEAQKSQRIDNWWMKTDMPANVETGALLEWKKEELLAMLNRHRGISAETESLAAKFKTFRPGVFINGGFRFFQETGTVLSPLTADTIGLYFVPEDIVRKNLMYNFMWSSDLNGFIVPGLQMPEPLAVAIMYHELGHAKRHNRVDGTAGPSSDDVHMAEEVEMNQFTSDILNSISQGAYYKLIDEIIKRKKREIKFDQVIAAVTKEDCRIFDAMFGCTGTEAPSKLLASMYAMNIGFRFCESRGQGMKEKMAVYRWFEANMK